MRTNFSRHTHCNHPVLPSLSSLPSFSKLREHELQNFDDIGTWASSEKSLSNVTHIFWCLGTTRAQAGSAEAFKKIDYEYAMSFAKAAKTAADGKPHFLLLSATNADANSWFLYPQTKGKLENDIGALGFSKYSIFHPGLLLTDTGERPISRLAESLAIKMAPMMEWMAPGKLAIKCSAVGKAMVKTAFSPSEVNGTPFKGAPGTTYSNKEMVNMITNVTPK